MKWLATMCAEEASSHAKIKSPAFRSTVTAMGALTVPTMVRTSIMNAFVTRQENSRAKVAASAFHASKSVTESRIALMEVTKAISVPKTTRIQTTRRGNYLSGMWINHLTSRGQSWHFFTRSVPVDPAPSEDSDYTSPQSTSTTSSTQANSTASTMSVNTSQISTFSPLDTFSNQTVVTNEITDETMTTKTMTSDIPSTETSTQFTSTKGSEETIINDLDYEPISVEDNGESIADDDYNTVSKEEETLSTTTKQDLVADISTTIAVISQTTNLTTSSQHDTNSTPNIHSANLTESDYSKETGESHTSTTHGQTPDNKVSLTTKPPSTPNTESETITKAAEQSTNEIIER